MYAWDKLIATLFALLVMALFVCALIVCAVCGTVELYRQVRRNTKSEVLLLPDCVLTLDPPWQRKRVVWVATGVAITVAVAVAFSYGSIFKFVTHLVQALGDSYAS